ncbi:MAG: class I adenylate-forming enzyme family protein [Rikenellaceae bacterium]
MINLSHAPLLQDILSNVKNHPDKIALIDGNLQISYTQLYDNIVNKVYYINHLKLKKGDKIVLSAQKEVEFIYLYFAAHILGVINVVVDSSSKHDVLDYIISLAKPKIVFGFDYEGYRCIHYQEIVNVDYTTNTSLSNIDSSDTTSTADIMFTTGTTGHPKGVVLSHHNIYSSAKNINSFIKNESSDIEVLGLPICHSFGLGRLRCTLIKGATLVLLGNFANLKLFFNAIEKYSATAFCMVPAVWSYIQRFSGDRISKYAEQIKYIEIGSAAMSEADKLKLIELFPKTRICMHYGLTEASRALYMQFDKYIEDLNSVGTPVSEHVEVAIIDENGNMLDELVEGEICIKGNMVMKTYFLSNDNKDAFWGDYFRTGDWGYRGKNGRYYLVSRTKELINVGGKKVSPIEIEKAITALGIKECVCIAVKDKNGLLGEVPKALIVKDGCEFTFEEIHKQLSKVIAPYKLPAEYDWIDEVPKTSSGKVQRFKLYNK